MGRVGYEGKALIVFAEAGASGRIPNKMDMYSGPPYPFRTAPYVDTTALSVAPKLHFRILIPFRFQPFRNSTCLSEYLNVDVCSLYVRKNHFTFILCRENDFFILWL